jgi:hypothetical protein
VDHRRALERAAGREMLWSPTIRAALIAGTPWLDPGCGTSRSIDLQKVDRHPPSQKGHVSNFAQTPRTGARIFSGLSLLTEGSCARLGTTRWVPVGGSRNAPTY